MMRIKKKGGGKERNKTTDKTVKRPNSSVKLHSNEVWRKQSVEEWTTGCIVCQNDHGSLLHCVCVCVCKWKVLLLVRVD